MAKNRILLALALVASFSVIQTSTHRSAPAAAWQPDKVSTLRGKTWYGVMSFIAMASGLGYNMYAGAQEQHKRHSAQVRAKAAREDRALTTEESAQIGSWMSKLSFKGTMKNIAGGLTLKNGFVGNVASWAILLPLIERIQWAYKTRGRTGDGCVTQMRRHGLWKALIWGGFSVSVITQVIQAAHTARDTERARLEALAKEEERELTAEELDSVSNALDFATSNAKLFGKAWVANAKAGIQGKGSLVKNLTTWFPVAAAAERAQWALQK